ncbi:MAG: hypothetical protein R3F34_03790 [Planctomycetota bacterium]
MPLFALLAAIAPIAQDPATTTAPPSLVHAPPSGCLAYLELRSPAESIREFTTHPVLAPLLGELAKGALADSPELRRVVEFFEEDVDDPFLDVLGRLSDAGMSAWVTLAQPPAVTFALDSSDAAAGDTATRRLLSALAEATGHPGALDAPTEVVEGNPLWSIGDELTVARVGATTLVSNSRTSIDLVVSPKRLVRGKRALAKLLEAHSRRSRGEDAFVWVDYGALTTFVGMAGEAAGPAARIAELAEVPRRPRLQSLLGPGISQVVEASSVVLKVDLDAKGALSVELDGDDLAGERALWAHTSPDFAATARTNDCAHALLYRDFGTMLAERESLFEPKSLAAIATTVSQLELFLGGLTLADDVLPHVSPWIEMVSREVPFARSPRPDLRLPAAAFVFHLEPGSNIGERLDAAFQGIVSTTNIQRAQNGQPSYRLELGREGDFTWTAAMLPSPLEGDPVDASYNLVPACAVIGDTWVVATHQELLLDLRDELTTPRSVASPATGSAVETLAIHGPRLATFAREQMDALVLANSLNEGKTREQSRKDMEGLAWILERSDVLLSVAYGPDHVVLRAEVDFPGRN